MERKKALLGFHDPDVLKAFSDLVGFEYDVTAVDTLDKMIDEMGLTSTDDKNAPPKNPFDVYLMDTNLGNGDSCEPAEIIYNYVKSHIEQGRSKYMSFTGSTSLKQEALEKGIPCLMKGGREESDYIDSLDYTGNA
jgi:hypothetical protein